MLRHVVQVLALYALYSCTSLHQCLRSPTAVCVPALSPCVPTAVFLRLSLDLLPVLSNPSTHCPGLFPLACVSQVGSF